MSDHLFSLRVFVRVARKGSFSAAGRDLSIPQSTVSRAIADLEREIGAALLVRTTRALTLTEAGADFLVRVEGILGELDEAEHAARGTGELRGVVRVGLGTSLGVREVVPRLAGFMDRYPELRVDLVMQDHRQDLLIEGVDVAFRFGPLADSSMVARNVASWPRVLVAAPAYLAKAGTPHTPVDLSEHAIIMGPSAMTWSWTLSKEGHSVSAHVDGRLTIRASEGAVAAATAGLGIVTVTIGACRRELGSGALVRVLPDWDAGNVELNAVFSNGKAAKPAARALVDYFVEAFRDL
jgi:DNA-binding transcriptional LysR family regulator